MIRGERRFHIQLFQLTWSDKSVKPTRQDRMVVRVFIGISVHVGVEEIYKFAFLHVKY
jgi:hypothetical protein